MIKKKIKKEKGAMPTVTEIKNTVVIPQIAPLEIDLGRGDLNILRDKINEIIAHGNQSIS